LLNKADDPKQNVDIEEEDCIDKIQGMLSSPFTNATPILEDFALFLLCSSRIAMVQEYILKKNCWYGNKNCQHCISDVP
jgi:hypothetical protein